MFIHPIVANYGPHVLETGVGGIVVWIGKYFFSIAKDEWTGMKETLADIRETSKVQAENHLKTIEMNTGKTNEILQEMVKGQAEMNGWLKGKLQ